MSRTLLDHRLDHGAPETFYRGKSVADRIVRHTEGALSLVYVGRKYFYSHLTAGVYISGYLAHAVHNA